MGLPERRGTPRRLRMSEGVRKNPFARTQRRTSIVGFALCALASAVALSAWPGNGYVTPPVAHSRRDRDRALRGVHEAGSETTSSQLSSRRYLGGLAAAFGVAGNDALSTPSARAADDQVVSFKVDLKGDNGGEGEIKVRLRPDWAPNGCTRFRELVQQGAFNDAEFFRAVPGFIAQFGLPAKPALPPGPIPDDPVKETNRRGTLTFAAAGKDTRCNQLFFNFKDNGRLDGMGFAPVGEVIEGMEIVDKIYGGYGEQPNQLSILMQGNKYLDQSFPKLSKIEAVTFAGN